MSMSAKPKLVVSLFTFILLLLLFRCSHQLEPSQFQALQQIKQLFGFPQGGGWISTDINNNNNADYFCNSGDPTGPSNHPTPTTTPLTLACYEYDQNVTQLHLTGTITNNYWFPPPNFPTSLLFTILSSFPNLKVLSLVSLGLRGPLPPTLSNLSSQLEILNLSTNYFDGIIPPQLSSLRNLQTLILDHNRFTGQVPDWFGSQLLPLLSVLSFKNNSLSGLLPDSLSSLQTLRTLALSANNLSGEVPALRNLTNLQVLDLEDNNFGPHFPSLPTKLVSLVLRKNKFSFPIKDELNTSYQLKKLDISFNQFVGPFSPSILSLPSLTYLDISGNKFTGMLSENTSCNQELSFVNLSSNRFTGELPACLKSNSNATSVLYSGNCLSTKSDQPQYPYSFCHTEALAVTISHSPRKDKDKRPYGKAVLASSMVGGVVGGMALLGLAFLLVKTEYAKHHLTNKSPNTRLILEKVSPAYTLKLLQDARYISETMKLGQLRVLPYRTFVLEEIREATNNFNVSNLIGEGSRGKVYKGWLTDGTLVAIRCLNMRKRHSIQTYTHQIELLSKLRHSHLVSAIGHCFECYQDDSSVSRIFVVSEFAPNGTLRGSISEAQPGQKFTWTQRMAAAIEVARGIQFLHTGIIPGIFSNHLKITDILLDHDFHVKISKYNLPLLAADTKSDILEISFCGSKENIDTRSKHEDKSDIYNIGVILLEIIVGRRIVSRHDIDLSKDIILVSLTADDMARRSIVDPAIHKECSNESLTTLLELCTRCLSKESSDRPSIEDVIWNLQFAAQVQDSCRRDSNSNHESPGHVS